MRGITEMKKPRNREERIKFILKKLGSDNAILAYLATLNDRQLKAYFDMSYPVLKDKEDYISPPYSPPECLVCENEVTIQYDCSCGNAIIDPHDTALQQLKDSGEFERIRNEWRV